MISETKCLGRFLFDKIPNTGWRGRSNGKPTVIYAHSLVGILRYDKTLCIVVLAPNPVFTSGAKPACMSCRFAPIHNAGSPVSLTAVSSTMGFEVGHGSIR
jgi:hypothetical protein